MKTLFTDWNFMRALRLVMGLLAIYYAITTADRLLGFAGALLVFMAVLNTGCCGSGGCGVQQPRLTKKQDASTTVSYEEIT